MLIANVLGIFLFLYVYWKKLKEDYLSEKIFNFAFILIAVTFFAYFISTKFLIGYWFWVVFLAQLITILIATKFKFDFFENFEGYILSILPWLSLFYLTDSVQKSSLSSFLLFWISLTLIFVYLLIQNFYRKFTWYKSGKIGFVSLSVVLLFFACRILMSAFFGQLISFATQYEIILSATVISISFLILFIRGRS